MIKLEVTQNEVGARVSTVEMTGTTEGLLIDLICGAESVLLKLMQDGVLLPDVDSVVQNVADGLRQQLTAEIGKFVKPGMGSDDKREGELQ